MTVSTCLRKVARPALLGGVDGVVTSFAVIAGSTALGSDMNTNWTLGIALASLLADGVSMGISEYISTRPVRSNIVRAPEEVETTLRRVLPRMPVEQLRAVRSVLRSTPELVEVLKRIDDNPSREVIAVEDAVRNAFACLLIFILSGTLVTIPWYLTAISASAWAAFSVSIASSLFVLCCLAVFRECVSGNIFDERFRVCRSVVVTLSLGVVAGGTAYGVGALVAYLE